MSNLNKGTRRDLTRRSIAAVTALTMLVCPLNVSSSAIAQGNVVPVISSYEDTEANTFFEAVKGVSQNFQELVSESLKMTKSNAQANAINAFTSAKVPKTTSETTTSTTTTTTSATTTTTTTTTSPTTTTTTSTSTSTTTETTTAPPVETSSSEIVTTTVVEQPQSPAPATNTGGTYSPYCSDRDYLMLTNVVAHEYGSYWVPLSERALVVEVIMNRVHDSRFPSTIESVLTAPYQFSGAESWSVWYANQGMFSPYVQVEDVKNTVNYYFEHIQEYQHGYLYFWGDGQRNHFS